MFCRFRGDSVLKESLGPTALSGNSFNINDARSNKYQSHVCRFLYLIFVTDITNVCNITELPSVSDNELLL